jgi:hypothetical protein
MDANKDDVRRVVAIAHAARDAASALVRNDLEGAPVTSVAPSIVDQLEPTNVNSSPLKVFVSWAHRGERWSDEESAGWAREVVEFTTRLRGFGLDAELDLFHTHETQIDWTRFGQQQVAGADFIVIAISEAWAERWAGTNNPEVGAGAVVEADTLKGILRQNQQDFQARVLIAVLPSQKAGMIPLDLGRLNFYSIDPDDPDSFDDLLRSITGQPLYVKPELGAVPVLPPGVAASLGVRKSATRTDEYSDYLALRRAIVRERARQEKQGRGTDTLSVLLGLMDALED